MPTTEGTGFTSGAGGWTGSHVPLPQGPVKHREPNVTKGVASPIVLSAVPAPVVVRPKPAPKRRQPKRAPGEPANRPTRLSPDRVRELVELYQSGQTTTQVAAALGMSKTTVLKYLEAEGVKRRPKHSTTRPVGRPRVELPRKVCSSCGATFGRREGERADNYRKRQGCGGDECSSWTRISAAS